MHMLQTIALVCQLYYSSLCTLKCTAFLFNFSKAIFSPKILQFKSELAIFINMWEWVNMNSGNVFTLLSGCDASELTYWNTNWMIIMHNKKKIQNSLRLCEWNVFVCLFNIVLEFSALSGTTVNIRFNKIHDITALLTKIEAFLYQSHMFQCNCNCVPNIQCACRYLSFESHHFYYSSKVYLSFSIRIRLSYAAFDGDICLGRAYMYACVFVLHLTKRISTICYFHATDTEFSYSITPFGYMRTTEIFSQLCTTEAIINVLV